MEDLVVGGMDLLMEKSRINTSTNKVNLIPSHYPPPTTEAKSFSAEPVEGGKLAKLGLGSSCLPNPVELEQTTVLDQTVCTPPPPPLPPREPTKCSSSTTHITPPPRARLSVTDVFRRQLPAVHINRTDKMTFQPCCQRVDADAFSKVSGSTSAGRDLQESSTMFSLSHPLVRSGANTFRDVDEVTHHDWNALQAKFSQALVSERSASGIGQDIENNCDGPGRMTTSELPATSALNQVVPLSRWPIGTRQPETHFALDRVVAKPQTGNWYVDSPLHTINKETNAVNVPNRSNVTVARSENPPVRPCQTVIMTQPTTLSSGKSNSAIQHAGKEDKEMSSSRQPSCKEGLICTRCGRCRCMSCTQPRPLPRCWVGPASHQLECSVQQIVNCCSCLCCVQALFYHCLYHQDDEEDIMMEPCSCCEGPRCCLRWTLMGLLLPFLPCLCLYCPLQCAVETCTSCYNGCSRRGCHCGRDISSSGSSTTRDLLLESEPSST